jgi:MerR family Zn(II)-responsive transcriptional regulator of zntA
MTVADLASKVGVPPHVIRYYARIGLLSAERNPNNGYRAFNATDVERMHFIRQTQRLGLPLREISAVLEQVGGNGTPVLLERRLLEQQLLQTQAELDDLRQREAWLRRALLRHVDLESSGGDLGTINHWLEACLAANPVS